MMLPLMEAFTTSCRPALNAKRAIISSVALPKVALRNPPSAGPTRSDSSSVACPIEPGQRMMASAEARKIQVSAARASSSAIAAGTKSSSQLSQFPRRKAGRDTVCCCAGVSSVTGVMYRKTGKFVYLCIINRPVLATARRFCVWLRRSCPVPLRLPVFVLSSLASRTFSPLYCSRTLAQENRPC